MPEPRLLLWGVLLLGVELDDRSDWISEIELELPRLIPFSEGRLIMACLLARMEEDALIHVEDDGRPLLPRGLDRSPEDAEAWQAVDRSMLVTVARILRHCDASSATQLSSALTAMAAALATLAASI